MQRPFEARSEAARARLMALLQATMIRAAKSKLLTIPPLHTKACLFSEVLLIGSMTSSLSDLLIAAKAQLLTPPLPHTNIIILFSITLFYILTFGFARLFVVDVGTTLFRIL